jgi:hypothetical protein
MCGLEQPARTTANHHIHRNAKMGSYPSGLNAVGIRSLLFLAIEIGFLLGAGVFADEMNFQVLNIALLCIVFNVGMPIWLLLTCLSLLIIDLFGLGNLYTEAIQYVL